MCPVEIVPAKQEFLTSFHRCLDEVAREADYMQMTEAPALHQLATYQNGLIRKGAPAFYAFYKGEVVGWCDIAPLEACKGCLGMGVRREFRGRGVGSALLTAALSRAREFGFKIVTLRVFTTNTRAIALYEKFGFRVVSRHPVRRDSHAPSAECFRMEKALSHDETGPAVNVIHNRQKLRRS